MKKSEVALQIRDGNEALRYSGKDRVLIIYLFRLHYVLSSFFSTWYVIFFKTSSLFCGLNYSGCKINKLVFMPQHWWVYELYSAHSVC